MSKLARLYEMPRPAGALGAPTRAALEIARRSAREFDVNDFIEWMEKSGSNGVNSANANGYLRRLTADTDAGERPSALKPLVVTSKGARGRGSVKTQYRYAFSGPAGTQRPDPKQAAPKKAPPSSEPDGDDEEDAELAAMGFTKIDDPDAQPDDDQQDAGEFSQSDDEDWGDEPQDAGSEQGDDASRNWIPQPDGIRGNYAESSMEKLAAKGFGPDNDVWDRVAQTSGDVDAHNLIRKEFPITLQRPALAVAKQIFQNIGKDWDGAGKESLSRLYRIRR